MSPLWANQISLDSKFPLFNITHNVISKNYWKRERRVDFLPHTDEGPRPLLPQNCIWRFDVVYPLLFIYYTDSHNLAIQEKYFEFIFNDLFHIALYALYDLCFKGTEILFQKELRPCESNCSGISQLKIDFCARD